MNEFEKASRHRLLRTRRLGDTLIVNPAGSLAGYGAAEANRELARVRKLLADPEIQSLVIDLHGADYFGTEMVGMFMRLQEACRGITAIVGANHGMRKVFEVMRLEELFSYYSSRRQALDAIASIPFRERLHPDFTGVPVLARRVATACAVVAVLWVAWSSRVMYHVVGSPIARDYCTLNELWSDFNRLEQVDVSYEEELARRNMLDDRLERLDWKASMRRSVFGDGGADEVCFQEALESFEAVLHDNDHSVDRAGFLHLMYCTRNNIARRTGLDLPPPEKLTPTDDA